MREEKTPHETQFDFKTFIQDMRFCHDAKLHHNGKSFFVVHSTPFDLSRSDAVTSSLSNAKNG